MKDVTKISKIFRCECGTTNKFEFETEYDVIDLNLKVRCQVCGRERTISLANFFINQPLTAQSQTYSFQSQQQLQSAQFQPYSQIQPSAPLQSQAQQNYQQNYNVFSDMFGQPVINQEQLNSQLQLNSQIQNQPIQDSTNQMSSNPILQMANALNPIEQKTEETLNTQQTQSIQNIQDNGRSVYAGLLNLEHMEEELLNQEEASDVAESYETNPIMQEIEEEIYEPFKQENEQTHSIQENAVSQPQTMTTEETKKEKITNELSDEETYSALFGGF
jgi:hypothetical protein